MKTHIVLASHGALAEGMLSAVEMIAGKQERVQAFGLSNHPTPQHIKELIMKHMEEHTSDRYIIVCDIKCGSVHNALVELCDNEQVILISGMNLALVLTLALSPNMEKEQLKSSVEEAKDNLMYFDKETIYSSNLEEDKLW